MKRLLIFLAILSNSLWGSSYLKFGYPSYSNYQESLMVLSSHGIPLSPIKKGLMELTVTPAYVKAHEKFTDKEVNPNESLYKIDPSASNTDSNYTEGEAKGFGGVISWFHGLGKNWGYALNFSHVSLSGKVFALGEYNNAGDLTNKHMATDEGSATQLMGFGVYDPFFDSENYKLPLFFGFGFYKANQEAALRATVNVSDLPANTVVNYKAEVDQLSYGLVAGGAFKYHTGDFDISPFFILFFPVDPPDYEVRAYREDTGAFFTSYSEESKDHEFVLPSGGITGSYRPWGVSFRYVPNIFNFLHKIFGDEEEEDIDQTVLTVSKTFEF